MEEKTNGKPNNRTDNRNRTNRSNTIQKRWFLVYKTGVHLSLAAKALGFDVSTPIFDGADEKDIQNTLEMANDYVNTSWEEFEAKYKDIVDPEVMEYLGTHLEHRKLWKGVPIGRDGKIGRASSRERV